MSTTSTNAWYYHYDPLGSVRNVTSTGTTQLTYDYEPYGTIRTSCGTSPTNLLKFTGEYNDPTGLYHLRARQYDPVSGRFLTVDPAGQSPGGTAITPYGYVAARPTLMADPSGEIFRSPATSRVVTTLASSVRQLIGDMARPMVALSPLTDSSLAKTSFRVRRCLFSALTPEIEREQGKWLPGKRKAVGWGAVSCSKPDFLYFRVCTQKVRAQSVVEERCNRHIARLGVGEEQIRIGPEVETRAPCPVIVFRSRIRTQTQSATSLDSGPRVPIFCDG